MPWPPWSSNSDRDSDDKRKPISWTDSLNATDWRHYTDPRTVVPALLLTTTILVSVRVYRSYIRRIPQATQIRPGFFRNRSLFGTVTRVGDGDGFHLFHQPGGRLLGWGWFPGRNIPEKRSDLKGNTIKIRLAGVDAPEGAYWGKPAQPYSTESLEWLKNYILGRRVRAYVYKRDQYERIVATVWVWKWFIRRDVGKQMLKVGLATVYEAHEGAEFGGFEEKYKTVEAKAKKKKKGMWSSNPKNFESPRDYKTRTADWNNRKHNDTKSPSSPLTNPFLWLKSKLAGNPEHLVNPKDSKSRKATMTELKQEEKKTTPSR